MSQPPSSVKSCPICGKPTVTEFRPFCSRHCSYVDLNRWLKGAYAVPAEEEDEQPVDGEGHESNGGST